MSRLTVEDLERARDAAMKLSDRKRRVVAVVIMANLDDETDTLVTGTAPSAGAILDVMVRGFAEAVTTGHTSQRIENDDPPAAKGDPKS